MLYDRIEDGLTAVVVRMELSPSVKWNYSVRKGWLRHYSAEGRLVGSRINIKAKNSLNRLCSILKSCRSKISFKVEI